MKRISLKSVPLLLFVLFTAGLLMVSASAENSWEGQFGLMDADAAPIEDAELEEQELPSYFLDLLNTAEVAVTGELTCSHPKTYPIATRYTADSVNPASKHTKTTIHLEFCSTCNTSAVLRIEENTESHLYYPAKRYISSNHNGPYFSHMRTYGLDCACCGYVQTEVISAGCGSKNCVDP